MSTPIYAAVVIAFVAVAVVLVRRSQRGAFVDRLPVQDDERVLLTEEGLKLAHRFRKRSVGGGFTVTHRVRSVLTDRRVLLATGGPEGRHEFVILMILDYTGEAAPVQETGYAAYRQKFELANGYPTYCIADADADVDLEDGCLRVVVPFSEAGAGWGAPPEVRLSTPQAERYLDAITAARAPFASR